MVVGGEGRATCATTRAEWLATKNEAVGDMGRPGSVTCSCNQPIRSSVQAEFERCSADPLGEPNRALPQIDRRNVPVADDSHLRAGVCACLQPLSAGQKARGESQAG